MTRFHISPFHLYHAPWSKRFKTYFLRGQYAWELQVGPAVIQLFYRKLDPMTRRLGCGNSRLRVWRDQYWSI